MTVPLSADSPRREGARRFAVELRRAMDARGVGRRRLADQVHIGQSLIAQYRAGNSLPRLDSALALAESLSWPSLATIVRSIRSDTCATCGKPFTNEGGGPKRYCSESCREVKGKLRAGTTTRNRADVAERRLTVHIEAVVAFCQSCEPEGYCHNSRCALRPVSPLLLRTGQVPEPELATPAPGVWGTAESRREHTERIRSANAKRWARPGEREAQSARTTAMHQRRAAS